MTAKVSTGSLTNRYVRCQGLMVSTSTWQPVKTCVGRFFNDLVAARIRVERDRESHRVVEAPSCDSGSSSGPHWAGKELSLCQVSLGL